MSLTFPIGTLLSFTSGKTKDGSQSGEEINPEKESSTSSLVESEESPAISTGGLFVNSSSSSSSSSSSDSVEMVDVSVG